LKREVAEEVIIDSSAAGRAGVRKLIVVLIRVVMVALPPLITMPAPLNVRVSATRLKV